MKLTTKMIKDIIREEVQKAKKERPSIEQIAKKLGAPVKNQEVDDDLNYDDED